MMSVTHSLPLSVLRIVRVPFRGNRTERGSEVAIRSTKLLLYLSSVGLFIWFIDGPLFLRVLRLSSTPNKIVHNNKKVHSNSYTLSI